MFSKMRISASEEGGFAQIIFFIFFMVMMVFAMVSGVYIYQISAAHRQLQNCTNLAATAGIVAATHLDNSFFNLNDPSVETAVRSAYQKSMCGSAVNGSHGSFLNTDIGPSITIDVVDASSGNSNSCDVQDGALQVTVSQKVNAIVTPWSFRQPVIQAIGYDAYYGTSEGC